MGLYWAFQLLREKHTHTHTHKRERRFKTLKIKILLRNHNLGLESYKSSLMAMAKKGS